MKTIRQNNDIRRVADKAAVTLVNQRGWSYAPKSIWKSLVRDVNKQK
jgi:hypothetical protein